MHIRKLELQGFKSFPDRTTFHFGDGIAGVVGPNGCGKSNVVEAVRWCIGEQSARSLRGTAMDDVIFAGSEQRRRVGVAEVTITLAADDTPFPGEWMRFDELAISRRIARGGGSEYTINQQKVRLRDIQELLLDTGVGNRLYAFIEQGRVGEIVQARPEQRRVLIEEAAGISRYKARRVEAEAKLEATRRNLEASESVVTGLRQQLSESTRQVKKAVRFTRFRAQAQQAEFAVTLGKYCGAVEDRRGLSGRVREGRWELERLKRTKDRLEAGIAGAREEEAALEAAMNQARDQLADLDGARRELESARTFHTREQGELAERAERLVSDIEQAQTKRAAAETSRDEAVAVIDQARTQLITAESGLTQAREHHQQGAEAARAKQQEHRALVDRVNRLRSEQATVSAQLEGLRARGRDAEESLGQQVDRIEQAQGVVSSATKELEETRETYGGLQQEEELARDAHARATEAYDVAKQTFSVLDDTKVERVEAFNTARRARLELDARHEALAGLIERNEGMDSGARKVLESVPGARALAREIRVPDSLGERLSQLLGPDVDAVCVPDEDAARAALDVVGDEAVTLVIDGESVPQEWLGQIEGSPVGRSALRALLGEVSAEDSLSAALRAASDRGAPCVTAEGVLVGSNGVIRWGGRGKESALLGRQHALACLQDDLNRALDAENVAEETVARADAQLAEAREALSTAHGIREQTAGRAQEARLMRQAGERRLAELQTVEQRALNSVATLQAQTAQFQQRIEHANSAAEQAVERLTGISAGLEEAVSGLEASEGASKHASQAAGVQLDALSALEVQVAGLRERVGSREVARTQANAHLRESVEMLERLRADQLSVAQRRQDLTEQMAETDQGLAALVESHHQTTERWERARVQLREFRASIRGKEEAVLRAQREFESANEVAEELAQRLEAARTLAEAMRVHADTEFGVALSGFLDRLARENRIEIVAGVEEPPELPIDWSKMPVVADRIFSRAELLNPEELAKLEQLALRSRGAMEALGDVNLTAVAEFRDLSKRFELLKEQREDLRGSVAEIESTIAHLDRTCRKRLTHAFQEVNGHFQTLYARMVPGGQAELRLTDDEDILEGGVEIVAQPPGKRLQHLSLLSGGEKAMTAIALIFALFRVRPSPFCLLDEVDAPLDEGNGARFNEVLKEMAHLAQFIVITHNKKTMEVADTLYGVTMPEPGVSRLVSVQLH